jgi:hypothetical protein
MFSVSKQMNIHCGIQMICNDVARGISRQARRDTKARRGLKGVAQSAPYIQHERKIDTRNGTGSAI